MLDPACVWSFDSKRPLTKWYDHVRLLPDKVVGQWFCVDRSSGQVDWQRTFFRPTTIVGFDDGVVVASETRSDGPWTAEFGCYGISLENGCLLWTSHRSGLWGRFVRLLDFIPGFTNELRDTPDRLEDGRIICRSGRILDVKTGRLIEKIDAESMHAQKAKPSIDYLFYDSGLTCDHSRIKVEDGLYLRHAQTQEGWKRGVIKIVAESEEQDTLWEFCVDQLDRFTESTFYSYRLAPPFIYLLVSEEPTTKPHPTKEHYALPNPTRWHFVTLGLKTGDVIQDFPLGDKEHHQCRIEDMDKEGLVIGKSNNRLEYYHRTQSR